MNRDIKFDYILKTNQQGSIYTKRIQFDYLEIFNGSAKKALSLENEIGYKVIAKREYTGLKDKNGVEIFEGDIVEFIWQNGDAPMHLEVKWRISDAKYVAGHLTYVPETSNIIGNIYENPELLNTNTKTEQYVCKSYFDETNELKECTCGECK